MRDLTKEYNYGELIEEEKQHYSKIEITEKLTEGGVHAHNSWAYYWKRVGTRISSSEFRSLEHYIRNHFTSLNRRFRVLSLASGYCGQEIMLAENLNMEYSITCTDINPELFGKAREVVREKNLNITFETADLNFIEIPTGSFDVIFAHAAIHHVINLEHLMEQIAGGLTDRGIFHLVEVTGKNRKLIWDENERFANRLLEVLPESISEGYRLNVPLQTDGMEGIRQEDILPLIYGLFEPVYECHHGAFMRFICTNPYLGKRLDPNDPTAKRCLDFLIDADESAVRNSILRPLEVWGVYRPRRNP